MKKMIKNLMLVAVAAMAFVGCQNDNDEMNVTVKKTVFEFTANIEETTRSYFGEKEDGIYPTLWEGNEMVSLVVLNSSDEIVATAHSTVEAEEGATTAKITATFEGELVNAAKLVAYIGSWDFNRTLDLDEQFASEVGKVNHTLISDNAWDGVSTTVLNFSHAVAYGNMTITDSPVELSKLSKVIVALDEVEYSISIGDMLESLNIWFACDADEDFETFKVSLVADNGVTYRKSVDMTEYAADKRLKFIKGHVSKFSISDFEKVAADHAVEFTKMAGPVSEDFGSWAGVGMKYTFSNDAGDTMQITFSEADGNPLKAGTYTNSSKCEDGCFYGNGTWIKLADADYETYISSGDVVVALVDDVYTVTYTGTIAGETYETTFTGEVTVWESFEGQWYSDTNYGLFARTVSGNEFYFDLYCDSSVGQVIPEGVYTYGWERPYFQYSTVNGSSITDGTVTVAHLESGYQIDINVTTANGNFEYSFSGIVALRDANNAFKNPPIEYKDITVEAEMATVTASYDEGYLNYYGDSFDLYITTEEVDGETYELTLALAIPIGESSNGLIPENTYTLGASDYTLTSESIGDSVKFANAQLVVAHEAVGYTLTFTGENLMKTEFILTYSGKIAKADEDNDFRNPGDATKLATPQNGQYTFNEDTKLVTITWDEVENAESYLISYDEVEETVNTNSYSFTGEFETYYNISIVAVPANGSALYKNSDSGWVSFTTPMDINAAADYNITLTKITAIDGNTISFTGDNAQDKLTLVFNPGLAEIVAGTYNAAPQGLISLDPYNFGTMWSSDSALEIGTYNETSFNISSNYNQYGYYPNGGAVVTVSISGTTYTIVALLKESSSYYKFTYTGKLEVTTDDEGGEGEVAATTFNFYGRWDNYYGLTSKSSGVYKLIGENFDIDFAIHYTAYNQTTGALVPGTYPYSYNSGYYPDNGTGYDADDYMYEGYFTFAGTLNGNALQNNYDSTLVVTDSGIKLTVMVDYAPAIVITAGQPTMPEPEPETLATPTGLVATPDVNTVTVSWTAVANAESYDVTCGVNKLTVEGTTAIFDELEADTTYEISVVAKADGYEDSPAASTTVTTKPAAVEPLPTINLNTISEGVAVSFYRQFTMSDGGNNSIKITLLGEEYSVSSQYSITSGTYSYLNSTYLNTTQFAVASCIINGTEVKSNISAGTMTVASEGDNYTITFDLTIDGNSQPIVVNATLAAPKYLTQPNITDALSTASDTIAVAWDAVANATSYDVTCGGELKNVTGTTATFTGLTADTAYTITVVAKANGYEDSPAATTTVTTQKGAVEPDPEPEPATVTVTAMAYTGNPLSGYSFTYTCANGTNITGTSKSLGTGITYALSTSTDVVFNTLSNIKVGSTVATSVSGTISIDGGANVTFNNVVIDGVTYVGSFAM